METEEVQEDEVVVQTENEMDSFLSSMHYYLIQRLTRRRPRRSKRQHIITRGGELRGEQRGDLGGKR